MSDSSSNNKRIIKNTYMLYMRMLFTTVVALYTSRIVLEALGVEDYGIYNLVGGLVVMLDFINSALYGASIRYITHIMGCGGLVDRKRVFSSIKFSHWLIAGITLILGETLGLWFVNTQLNIPSTRIYAAMWTYQCSLGVLLLAIVSLPYTALIMSYEKMSAFAYITVIDVLLKLSVAIGIIWFSEDKLIFYVVLMFGVQLLMRIIYTVYCYRNFEETKAKAKYSKEDVKQIFSFTSWKICGSTATLLSMQGTNILLNIFFGPVVNAARGIANQVHAALLKFCSNFIVAVKPQIIKSYAQKDIPRMHSLILFSSKMTVYLTLVMIVPLYAFTPGILKIWLGEYPEYSIAFVRIILIQQLAFSLNYCLEAAIEATGRIKKYQIITGGISMITLPVSYVSLKWFSASPVIVMGIYLAVELLVCAIRIIIIMPMISLPIWQYIKKVVIPIGVPMLVNLIVITLIPEQHDSGNIIQLFTKILLSVLGTCIIIMFIGLTKNERINILRYMSQFNKKNQE